MTNSNTTKSEMKSENPMLYEGSEGYQLSRCIQEYKAVERTRAGLDAREAILDRNVIYLDEARFTEYERVTLAWSQAREDKINQRDERIANQKELEEAKAREANSQEIQTISLGELGN